MGISLLFICVSLKISVLVIEKRSFANFQTFERSRHFSPYLRASYKILQKIRAAVASVVGLVYLSSNLQIIILCFRN